MTVALGFGSDERLAVYGSLAPGQSNQHVLADMAGIWVSGWIRGHLHQAGWGALQGYPGIFLDLQGPQVAVQVFCSHLLPSRWQALDAFEGHEYRRSTVKVMTEEGVMLSQIYELAHPRLA